MQKFQYSRILLSIITSSIMIIFMHQIALAQEGKQVILDDHLSSMRTGMSVLGAWSVSNLIIGGVMRQRTESVRHYFHEMNAAWNLVNLGIASFGYLNLPNIEAWSALEGLRELEGIDRILIFNAGLDLAYMAFGYALIERGQRLNSDRSLGYGRSLILQGAFLFLFDSAFAYLHSGLTDQLRVSLLPTESGLSINLLF